MIKANNKLLFVFLVLLIIPSVIAESGRISLFPPGSNSPCPYPDCTKATPGPWTSGYTESITLEGVSSSRFCYKEGQWVVKFYNDCILQSSASPCSSGGFSSTVNAHYVNWDNDEDSCNCLRNVEKLGVSWNSGIQGISQIGKSGGPCCGDDGFLDTGTISTSESPGKYMCLMTKNGFEWVNREAGDALYGIPGNVYFVNNPSGRNFTVLSDDKSWIACHSSGNYISQSNFNPNFGSEVNEFDIVRKSDSLPHEYICAYNPQLNIDQFVECAGEEGSCDKSVNEGDPKVWGCAELGENVGGFYCTANAEWTSNLGGDTTGESCRKAGFKWTGTKCCANIPYEDSYNDWLISYDQDLNYAYGFTENDIGGCIAGTKVFTNTRASDYNILNNSWNKAKEVPNFPGVWVVSQGKTASQDISRKLYPGKNYAISASFRGIGNNFAEIFVFSGSEPVTKISSSDPSTTFSIRSDQFSNLRVELRARENPEYPKSYAIFEDVRIHLATNKIMNFNGIFYGCYSGEEGAYDDVTTPQQNDLIAKDYTSSCAVEGNFFCMQDGWHNESVDVVGESEPLASNERIHKSVSPAGELGCCGKDQCWNGKDCVPSQKSLNIPGYRTEYGGKTYICSAGNWLLAEKKYDLWGREGYCSKSDDCLLDKYGSMDIIISTRPEDIPDKNINPLEIEQWPYGTKANAQIDSSLITLELEEKNGSREWSFLIEPSESTPINYSSEEDFLRKCVSSNSLCKAIITMPDTMEEDEYKGKSGELTTELFVSGNVKLMISNQGNLIIQDKAGTAIPGLTSAGMLSDIKVFGTEGRTSENPSCVPANTKVGDYLCSDGDWTTRTRKLAMTMIKMAGNNDFVLFCDYWKRALPYADKISQDVVKDYIAGEKSEKIMEIIDESKSKCGGVSEEPYPCTNNYCIVKYKDSILIGTSLNKDIDDEEHSFLKGMLKKEAEICNDISGSMFKLCGDNKNIIYNKDMNAIIYSSQDIEYIPSSEEGNLMNSLINSIKNIVANIRNRKFSFKPPSYIEQDFADRIGKLNKIYINKKGSRTIMAASEVIGREAGKPTLTVSYPKQITASDICQSVQKIYLKEGYRAIDCIKEGNTFQLTSIYSASINNYWQDLTSSLRLQEENT